MKVGRNQPCPCGSGRKYKVCCLPRDRAAATSGRGRAAVGGRRLHLPADVVAEARRQPAWEADLVALPAGLAGSDRSYMAAALVAAGPVVVGMDTVPCRGTEPDQVAEVLAGTIEAAAVEVGAWPETVVVRHPEVAAALEERFSGELGALGRGERSEVEAFFYLDALDPAARSLIERVAGEPIWPPIAHAQTWAAWGLPDDDVAALFAALARYYRAAPWRVLDDAPPLTAWWPAGDEWTLAVLGAAGETLGLGVYADLEDYEEVLGEEPTGQSLDEIGDWIVGVTFVVADDLPRPMRREIARAGWEVAAPAAYPLLMPMLTPGGGITRKTARRLADVLDAVVALVEDQRESVRDGRPAEAEGPGGVTVEYPGEDPDERGRREMLPPELRDVLEGLRSGSFETMADAEAHVTRRVTTYNETPRDDLSGLTPRQAQTLIDAGLEEDGPLRLVDDLDLDDLEDADFLHNARTLLAAVHAADGAPATDAGNLKRAFVADMLERMRWPDGELETIRRMNKVINEGDVPLLHRLRVVLDVAGLVQRRTGRFRITARGRELLPEDRAGRLMAHLFRTYFRDYNIGYGGRGLDTAPIQQGVPLFLARLPREAADWVDRDELAATLLPPQLAAEDPDAATPGRLPLAEIRAIQLAVHVFDPLARFGLVEERGRGGGPDRWSRDVEVRTTPLFERFVRVEWEGETG